MNHRSFSWEHIPSELRFDIEFARSFVTFSACKARSMFSEFEGVRGDRTVWENVVPRKPYEVCSWGDLADLLRDFATADILADRELMVKACTYDAEVATLVDGILRSEQNFLATIVDRNYFIFFHLPREIQRKFPNVVDRAMRKFQDGSWHFGKRYNYHHFTEWLDSGFWEDRAFVLRYFECGFPYFSSGDPFDLPSWKSDKEIFLRVADHCHPSHRRRSFREASMTLRNDKKFMEQVLELDPSLFLLASQGLQVDFDLCMIVFSSEQSVARTEVSRRRMQNNSNVFVENFWIEAKRRLDAHRNFTSVVLPAMSQTSEVSCNALATLNQGAETSLNYKKRVAQYLNVPMGKQLRLLRRAYLNLCEILGNENDGPR